MSTREGGGWFRAAGSSPRWSGDRDARREIADHLSYSEQTIKKLITALEGRMEARTRAHLIALAIRRGLI